MEKRKWREIRVPKAGRWNGKDRAYAMYVVCIYAYPVTITPTFKNESVFIYFTQLCCLGI